MERQMLPYVDGRLKAREVQEIEKHLLACPACRLRVNEFRAVSGLIDELPQIVPSAAFDLRVHALVAAEPLKKSWWTLYMPSPRIAFAASMLLLAAIWMGSHPGPVNVNGVSSVSNPAVVDPQDLPVLENYDVISSFEPLTELPQPVQANDSEDPDATQSM
jgi:anti-sigma factor RsiW